MRIVHLIHNYHPSVGGSQLVFQRLSEGFVALFDDEVTVLTTNALQSPHELKSARIPAGDEMLNGVKVRRFGYSRGVLPALRLADRGLRRLGLPGAEYVRVLRHGPISLSMFHAFRRLPADVIGATSSSYLHMLYPAVARRLGPTPPLVYFGALHASDGKVERPVLRGIGDAAVYVAYTAYEHDILVRHGVPAEKIHVQGLAVDVEQLSAADGSGARTRLGLRSDPVVAFIGRQAAHKGVDTLIVAMRSVWQHVPNARLLIAGARTVYSVEVDALLKKLGPAERARVHVVDDFSEAQKPELFAACDVLVSVSREESFGLVYLEAWAAGKPVVGSRIPAVESVVRDGCDGLLVPYRDAEALSSAIASLLLDQSLRARLGAHGQARVRREHTWERVIRYVHALYEQVAEQARTEPR
ncbi:MAG: glycosyltransferase family 4 protein [Gemmatimonadaceae bacterium]